MNRPSVKKVVCLDVGSSGLRAAQFTIRNGPWGATSARLDKHAAVPLTPGAVVGGVVMDPAAVGKALRALWSAGRFATKRVAFGLANDRVLVRQLELGWMEPADFRKALPYAVADQIPMSVEDANLDYHVLEDIPAGPEPESERALRVLLVAAAAEMVNTYLEALAEADLVPVHAELAPFALIRAAEPTPDIDADAAEAIVDIGAETLTVVVHAGGQPRFVRTVAQLAGRAITGDLQQKFGWSYEEAEAAKAKYGLPRPRVAGDDHGEHPAQQAIEERVGAVVDEVRTTLNFFLTAGTGVRRLTRVVLTGGGARLSGLAERLGATLATEVVTLAPPAQLRGNVSAAAEDDLGALALLSGLALGVS